jgi:hypothetical protein
MEVAMSQRASAPPAANATVSGALTGLIVFLIVAVVERFVFPGHGAPRYSLLITLVGAAGMGALFGAIVGLVVAVTQSIPAGIGTGAVLFALLKFSIIGVAGGFTVMAVGVGLIYGAILGWAVSASAAKSLESGR